jgi:hypothetical protein
MNRNVYTSKGNDGKVHFVGTFEGKKFTERICSPGKFEPLNMVMRDITCSECKKVLKRMRAGEVQNPFGNLELGPIVSREKKVAEKVYKETTPWGHRLGTIAGTIDGLVLEYVNHKNRIPTSHEVFKMAGGVIHMDLIKSHLYHLKKSHNAW